MTEKAPSEMFRARWRQARDLRGLDQAELARRASLPASSISHFEHGPRKPSFENLRRLAQALNVTTDYLLGRVDDPDVAAEADPLYRDMRRLTDNNRTLAQNFMKMLANLQDKGRDDTK